MNTWLPPLPLRFLPDPNPNGFAEMKPGFTGVPFGPDHPGAFGYSRVFHVHEGVDLYCPEGTPVFAMETGLVVAVIEFTGPAADSPWWLDTQAVLVEGQSGVIVYGEIEPAEGLKVGDSLSAGAPIGAVKRVLRRDKGRPMSMLHIELHQPGTREVYEWNVEGGRPLSLLDPTLCLLEMMANQIRGGQES